MGFNFDKSSQDSGGGEVTTNLSDPYAVDTVKGVYNSKIGGNYNGLYFGYYQYKTYSESPVYVPNSGSYQFTTTQWNAQTTWSSGHGAELGVRGRVYFGRVTNTTVEMTIKAVVTGAFGGYDNTINPTLPQTGKTNFTISTNSIGRTTAYAGTSPLYTFYSNIYVLPGYSGSISADLYAYTTGGGTLPDMSVDSFGKIFVDAQAYVLSYYTQGRVYIK